MRVTNHLLEEGSKGFAGGMSAKNTCGLPKPLRLLQPEICRVWLRKLRLWCQAEDAVPDELDVTLFKWLILVDGCQAFSCIPDL